MPFTYKPEHLAFIKEAYKYFSRNDIAREFNKYFKTDRTTASIIAAIKNHGIKSGRTGKFPKGQQPWNTGTKGVMKGSCTSFKKGNRPHTWVPVGTEALTTRDNYIKVKVADPNKWRFKHHLVWEQHNGPIPKGMVIVFKDGDRQNCAIENLQMIDRGVLAQYNKHQYSQLPPELRTTARAVAQVTIAANKLKRAAQ